MESILILFYSRSFDYHLLFCCSGITDIAKRLDVQKSCAEAAKDIFTIEGEILRGKLKHYCEKLIFKDPLGHARKIEELLWRKGFYDAVSAAKQLRKVIYSRKK